MKKLILPSLLALVFTGSALAADHAYQVTGPVLSMTDKTITVQKGKDPWTVSLDGGTKTTGTLKVGAKVTISYHMTADTVTVK